MTMVRTVLVISLLANALLGVGFYRIAGDYDRLLVWACDHGNGGHECGEE
jgi:hypothetical protein